MFLTSDNKLLWKRIVIGTVVMALLLVLGLRGADELIYVWAMQFQTFGLWHIIERVFDAKIWLIATTAVLLLFFVKRIVKSIVWARKENSKFNLKQFCVEFWHKVKTSNAFLIFSSVVCASALVGVLKVLIARLRPIFFVLAEQPEFNRFSDSWHSMPSGHTTVTFAGLVMMGMLAPKYKPLTWTLAIIVGFSRIAIGAHWPTDVIVGAFIGMMVADLVKWALLKK